MSWDIGFDAGFYQVLDVSRERLAQLPGLATRVFSLPLIAVRPPAVSVQVQGWSWAAVAAEFPSWAAVAAAFETWADVARNNRKPGF